MASTEKNDWKNEYKQIKKKVSSFEVDILKIFPFIQTTTMKNELIIMSTTEEKGNFDRAKEREEIFINLSFLRKDIRGFKEKIKYFDKSDQSLRKIEENTLVLEGKIGEFQAKQMKIFEDLTNDEDRMTSELDIFYTRLDSYENTQKFLENKKKPLKYHSSSAIPEETDSQNGELHPANPNTSFFSDKENHDAQNIDREDAQAEISNLDSELQKVKKSIESLDRAIRANGGISCTWPEEEHKDFLKLRTKHKNNMNRAIFIEDCVSVFPLFDRKDIMEHIERFRTYSNLENEKKALVENYKLLKEERRRKMLSIIDEEQKMKDLKMKQDSNMKKEEVEKQKKLKEQLKDWKRKKLSLREIETEKKIIEDIERKKQEERRLIEKKEKVSQRLKEYKESKEIEKQQKTQIQQLQSKKSFDPAEIERIRAKEEQILLRKKQLLERKKSSEEEKRRRIEKLIESKNVKFGYVESKLNEETKAIIAKKTEKFDPKKGDQAKIADTFGGMIGKGPSRAIPSWRQGV